MRTPGRIPDALLLIWSACQTGSEGRITCWFSSRAACEAALDRAEQIAGPEVRRLASYAYPDDHQ